MKIMEIWKKIDNFPNYMISNLGRVKSLNYRGNTKKEVLLTPYKNNEGYLGLNLWNNGKCKHYTIHRLVAQAFISNPENKPFIDHINTIRNDNRVENLRWVTSKENRNNPLTLYKIRGDKSCHYGKFGILNNNHRIILQYTEDGVFIKEWGSTMDIHRELGIDNSSISKCCRGKYKTAGGFIWRYKKELKAA